MSPDDKKIDDRSPEERDTAMIATALFSKRADGRIEMITQQEAAQLLGFIDSYHTGQGSFNVLVPQRKILDLDLSKSFWSSAATERRINGQNVYDLDAIKSSELIARLEVLSERKWSDLRAARTAVDASRNERKIR